MVRNSVRSRDGWSGRQGGLVLPTLGDATHDRAPPTAPVGTPCRPVQRPRSSAASRGYPRTQARPTQAFMTVCATKAGHSDLVITAAVP